MFLNIGIGDFIYNKVFLEAVKHKYNSILIAPSIDALPFWHNNDPKRRDFNNALGHLLFSEPPFQFIPNPPYRFPFYPNDRIARELNNIPLPTNFDCLCVGTPLNLSEPYVVLTTKTRQFPKTEFESIKDELASVLQQLATKYRLIILGERKIEPSREYTAECNKDQIFSLYSYFQSILPPERVLDLTIPALGITAPNLTQLQQDCLIMRQSRATITFGIGGNLWLALAVSHQTVAFRTDTEPTTDLMHNGFPGLAITKQFSQFVNILNSL